jgi:hypothetical protein
MQIVLLSRNSGLYRDGELNILPVHQILTDGLKRLDLSDGVDSKRLNFGDPLGFTRQHNFLFEEVLRKISDKSTLPSAPILETQAHPA